MTALNQYMLDFLGGIATELGWTTSDVAFAVTDTLEAYGVDAEADATDLVKLHALGKVKVLEAVMRETANSVDFSADNANIRMSQLHDHIKSLLDEAEQEAMQYLPEYQIQMGTIDYPSDPYERVESLSYQDLDIDQDFNA